MDVRLDQEEYNEDNLLQIWFNISNFFNNDYCHIYTLHNPIDEDFDHKTTVVRLS